MSLHPDPVQAPAPAAPLARLAGPAAVVAGLGLVATQLVQMLARQPDKVATVTDPVYAWNAVAQFGVLCVLVVAAMALHDRRAGVFGTVGVVAAVVGTVNVAGNYWFEAFVTPWLATASPGVLDIEPAGMLLLGGATSYGLFALGWVLFGVAGLRAPAVISAGVVVGGAAAFLIGQPSMGVPLGLAVTALGVWAARA